MQPTLALGFVNYSMTFAPREFGQDLTNEYLDARLTAQPMDSQTDAVAAYGPSKAKRTRHNTYGYPPTGGAMEAKLVRLPAAVVYPGPGGYPILVPQTKGMTVALTQGVTVNGSNTVRKECWITTSDITPPSAESHSKKRNLTESRGETGDASLPRGDDGRKLEGGYSMAASISPTPSASGSVGARRVGDDGSDAIVNAPIYRELMRGLRERSHNWCQLMESLVCLHYECDIHPNTLHLAAVMAARFLAKQTFLDMSVEANMRLVSSLALFSSAKFEDGYSLRVSKFLTHIGEGYREETFLRAEVSFCHIVDFDFFTKTRFAYAMELLDKFKLCDVHKCVSQKYVRIKMNVAKDERRNFNTIMQLEMGFLVRYALEMSLWDAYMFAFDAKDVAAAALSLAVKILRRPMPPSRHLEPSTVLLQIEDRLHKWLRFPLGSAPTTLLGRHNKSFLKYSKKAFVGVPSKVPPTLAPYY